MNEKCITFKNNCAPNKPSELGISAGEKFIGWSVTVKGK